MPLALVKGRRRRKEKEVVDVSEQGMAGRIGEAPADKKFIVFGGATPSYRPLGQA